MSYYATIEEDVVRAKAILGRGKTDAEKQLEGVFPDADLRKKVLAVVGGSIPAADNYAAYQLLASLSEEVERLRQPVTVTAAAAAKAAPAAAAR